MPQLGSPCTATKDLHDTMKITHDAAKTQCSQISKILKKKKKTHKHLAQVPNMTLVELCKHQDHLRGRGSTELVCPQSGGTVPGTGDDEYLLNN